VIVPVAAVPAGTPFTLHTTLVLLAYATVAVNVCELPKSTVASVGVTATLLGVESAAVELASAEASASEWESEALLCLSRSLRSPRTTRPLQQEQEVAAPLAAPALPSCQLKSSGRPAERGACPSMCKRTTSETISARSVESAPTVPAMDVLTHFFSCGYTSTRFPSPLWGLSLSNQGPPEAPSFASRFETPVPSARSNLARQSLRASAPSAPLRYLSSSPRTRRHVVSPPSFAFDF
jgi:hypothetical protein